MNILFLTMSSGWDDIETSGIYTDLMRKFCANGHEVYIVYPNERRSGLPTRLLHKGKLHCLGVKTLNVTQTHIIEKGIGQLLIEHQFTAAIKKHFGMISFDVILYSTPPITFTKVIKRVQRLNPLAVSYLLLKDIFPQNAVDLGLMTTHGIKGLIYRFFRYKEQWLYRVSDYIGCMSPANVAYLLRHNSFINKDCVEVAPNSYEVPLNAPLQTSAERNAIREKYGLPLDVPIFIYGGNMGLPQGIPHIIDCMRAVKDRNDCHFLIIGNGTEYHLLEKFISNEKPAAVTSFKTLPKDEYDRLARACDVGLIFLDYRFTIPNYPSRLLPYIMERKPIIAVTDPHCDAGTIAQDNGYGFFCPSNSVDAFVHTVERMLQADMTLMGEKAYQFFLNNYTTDHTYNAIMKHI